MAGDGGAQGWWALPESVELLYVETEEQLESARDLLGAATCCAIDAEWPPEETAAEARSGGTPHATLVQLALWLPRGGAPSDAADGRPSSSSGPASSSGTDAGRRRGSGSCTVLLLDMMSLPGPAAKQALQDLFRNKACLKLGFGLVHDLLAIAAALGGEGGSCIAVVEPACDLGSIHRFLRHQGVPGVHKAVDLGLSGLVEAQLGRPLDKQQQCSAWGKRPLSPQQLTYAAADAACLLGLLGSLVLAVGQPEEWPMGDSVASTAVAANGTAAAAVGGGTADGAADGTADGPADGTAVGEHGEAEQVDEQQQEEAHGCEAAPATEQQQQQAAMEQHHPSSALLAGCSPHQLAAAAAAWGARLEISGGRAVRRSSKRGGQRRRQARAAGGKAGKGLPPGCSGFPLHVPWMSAERKLTGEPRFLCDVMAEGLARQLRLCGFDAESLQLTMEKAPRHAVWRAMAERGEAEGRVVLTRDRIFVGANYSDQAFLVQADTKREQLEEVLSAFGLAVVQEDLLTRCARCNGEFLPEPLPFSLLPEDHGVPPGIQANISEFWVCSKCDGVFWQGSQYCRARQQMTDLIAKMTLGVGSGSGKA